MNNSIHKDEFLKQKLTNFSIFIKDKIGSENKIYDDVIGYTSNIELFLQDFHRIVEMSPTVGGRKSFTVPLIDKYLLLKGVDKKLEDKSYDMINKYFSMFYDVIYKI